MTDYFVGALLFGIPWIILFFFRRDLRWPMIWTSLIYVAFSGVVVFSWFILSQFVYLGDAIVPSYWYPPTFFNLGMITGFAGIEDLLWLFFIGGIATCIYEVMSHSRIEVKRSYKVHLIAFVAALIGFLLFQLIFKLNLIYGFIFSNLIGAFALWIERRDLIKHSIIGAVSFLIVYTLAFIVTLIVFPDLIKEYYNLGNISGFLLLGIPIEEYLYAITFGLLWGPIYEYTHGWRCSQNKS